MNRLNNIDPILRTWLIWGALGIAALLLFATGAASFDAPAVSQPLEHRISIPDVGRVGTIDVKEGQTVKRGQIVLRLDTREIDAQIAQAKADLDLAIAGVPATALNLETESFGSRRTLLSEEEQAERDLAELRASVGRDQGELRAVIGELAQEQELLEQGLVRSDRANELLLRRSTLEQSTQSGPARIQSASLRLTAARTRLREWDRNFAIRAGTIANPPEANADVRSARLQPMEAQVFEKKVTLANLEQRRSAAAVTAPADGTVQSILMREGDVIRPGDPAITMIERNATQLIAYVSERTAVSASPGTPVLARRRYAGNPLEGVVTDVAGAVSLLPARFWPIPQMPVYGREVYIRLTKPAELAPGERVDVRFGTAAATAPTPPSGNDPAPAAPTRP